MMCPICDGNRVSEILEYISAFEYKMWIVCRDCGNRTGGKVEVDWRMVE